MEDLQDVLYDKLSKEDSSVTDEDVELLLYNAKMIILNKRYPFQEYPTDENGEYVLEDRYISLQLRIATELFAKEGVEGELTHTENGITRQYASGSVSPHLLKEITPKGKVI